MISGISINRNDSSILCSVNDFSDELKQLIREQLSSVWNGFSEVEDLPEIHSYKRTLNSFLDRYRSKSEDIQKGMIGELLSHILIGTILTEFRSLSVLKNKEERSIKKGFDIIYFDELFSKLWYSEVKSGRSSADVTVSKYNTELLKRAHNGISEMFEGKRASLWESALIDVKLTIEESKGRLKLAALLDADSPVHKNEEKKNVVLISVLYNCPTDPIDLQSVIDFFDAVKLEDCYSDVIIFSVQKKLFEKVAEFLESEVA